VTPQNASCVAAIGVLLSASAAHAQIYTAGDLLVSSSTYDGNASSVTVGSTPGGVALNSDGSFNNVFQNANVDSSFGITSEIDLQSFNLSSNSIDQSTNLTQLAAAQGVNLSTSFSSKSELSLNTSANGSITFMGYNSAVNSLDVSNSNTPGVNDPSNPVTSAVSRAIGTISGNTLTVTNTNAYSGNNGRAAILNNGNYYLVGNAGNSGKNPKPTNAVLDTLSGNTGVQMIAQGSSGNTTVVGAYTNGSSHGNANGDQYGFSVTQIGSAADKTGKDDNFRGETIFNNTLYVTKGSGSNGVNTVYQVGTAGSLPNASTASSTSISILPGFNTTLATTATSGPNPFGIWFANANTLYVADEGDGTAADAATSPYAGLEKWSLSGGLWHEDYVLNSGLNLGQNYTVSGYLNADGSISKTGGAGTTAQAYTTATDGLRNLTGVVNADGTVTLYAITSTVSTGTGDQGADPNKLVAITDTLSDSSAAQASGETFTTLETASYGQVLRGVGVAPVPLPAAAWLMLSGLGGLGAMARKRKAA
jgi:hypothetical protein